MFPNDLQTDYPEVAKFLTNAILKNRLANSYVLIGKNPNDILRISKTLAKILNCTDKGLSVHTLSKPCEECLNCKWIERDEHPQAFINVKADPESKKEQIKIDNIRELLNTLNITSDYFRIVFFQASSLQFLPSDSCNLLLKTVEETPERTIFIFGNQSRNDILGTILSRSQTIYINKKSESIFDALNVNASELTSYNFTEYFPKNVTESLEKSRNAYECIQKDEVDLNDFLINLAVKNYDRLKYEDQKQFCHLHYGITNAYAKLKSFMQPKIVVEDLFLNFLKK